MTDKQVTKEQIEEARKLDLLSYLQRYEPNELVKLGAGVYSTRTNDSLKISNGRWYRWSRGYGGISALDYLVKVQEMDFVKAVRHLCGLEGRFTPSIDGHAVKPVIEQSFRLPERNQNNDRVIAYLLARGIHYGLIRSCVRSGRIYEDTRHNCVFVGVDGQDKPRYAFIRSSDPASTFMHEVRGSDKRYSFSLPAQEESSILNVFESAIDALSFVSLELMDSEGWKPSNYISLSGVYQPGKDVSETPLPVALERFLHENGQIEKINLCFDKDRAGEIAAQGIARMIERQYEIRYTPPELGKDYNEQLMAEKGLSGVKTRKSKINIIQEEVSR